MTGGFGRFLRRNAIALLALFLALGGTTYAAGNLINGSQIKSHTIAKSKLTNKAVSQLKGNRGNRGPAGTQGPAGQQGPAGPQGAQGPAGTPNPNATALNGYAANELLRVAQASTSNRFSALSLTTLKTVSITAPKAGFVIVTGNFQATNSSTTCPCEIHARLKDDVAGTTSVDTFENIGNPAAPATTAFTGAGLTWVFPVTAGARSFDLLAAKYPTAATLSLENPVLTAVYIPFGSTGGSTLGPTVPHGPLKPEGTTQVSR